MIFFDTESVGSNGPLVTIQYGQFKNNKLNIIVDKIWEQDVEDTLATIEGLTDNENGICGFNLVHDWFVLTKWYNIFRQVEDKNGPPSENQVRRIEAAGPRDTDVCLKPKRACDLMLIARSTNFQYLAKHKPIIIRKVPTAVIDEFIGLLQGISLPRGVKIRWRISEKRSYQRSDVKDIMGEFQVSTSLKFLASIILNKPEIANETFSRAFGTIPFRDAPDWCPWGNDFSAGLHYMQSKIETPLASEYIRNDVLYTFELWKALGCPQGGDDDSELACLVGAAHWKGYAVANRNIIRGRIISYKQDVYKMEEEGVNCNSPVSVLEYLHGYLNDMERLTVNDTKRTTLEELARWESHPVQSAVRKVQTARRASKRVELLQKLVRAGRFCFSMKVVGTLSSRMSGGSDYSSTTTTSTKLNAQGIPREKDIRELFLMAFEGERLEGGDFDAFEVTILDAVVHDEQLSNDLLSGKKIHAITGCHFYSMPYDEILATKGTLDDKYTRIKNTFFAWVYGATTERIAKTANVSEEVAESGVKRWKERYPTIHNHRETLRLRFSPIIQNEFGGKVEWYEPEEYIESIMGFRRYFTLEWSVLRGLYELASQLPITWNTIRGEIRRTNRAQTISGATRSAIYAALFGLQAYVFRAAANHEIQSPGAQVTKRVQRCIWDLQPNGIHDWRVRPLNIHDEVLTCSHIQHTQEFPITVQNVASLVLEKTIAWHVEKEIKNLQTKIPKLSMTWKSQLKNWSDK